MTASNTTSNTVQELRHALLAVRSYALQVWWATMILGVLGAASLALLAAVSLDQILHGLPAAIRLLLLLGVIAAPVAAFWRSLQSKPGGTLEDLALLVERRYPDLDNVLINTLQLAQSDSDEGAEIVGEVANQARERIHSIKPNSAIRKRALALAASAALLGTVILVVYALVNAKALAAAIDRVIAPLGHNTLTRIIDITPGDTDVLIHSDVTIEATLGGRVPTQAELVCQFADGRRVNVTMTPALAAVPDRLFCKLPDLEQDATYKIIAGDETSDRFNIRVHHRPTIQHITNTVTPPEYIHAQPVEQDGGQIKALPGSRVTLKIQSSEPLKAGAITFPDGRRSPLQLVPATAGMPGPITGAADITVKQNERYNVELTSGVGFDNETVSYDVVALEDKSPIVDITDPSAGELITDIAAKVNVQVRATDDYAVKEVRLIRSPLPSEPGRPGPGNSPNSPGNSPTTKDLVIATWTTKDRDQAKFTNQVTIDVAALGLSDSTPIILTAQAIDYRPGSTPGVSSPLTIRLKPAIDDDTKDKAAQSKVSLENLILKQRSNLAASDDAQRSETKPGDKMPRLIARQEEIRTDALALINLTESSEPGRPGPGQPDATNKTNNQPTTQPATTQPDPDSLTGVKRTLANLSDTLMVVAIEQLRASAAASGGDPRATLPHAIDTQKAILAALIVADARQDAELAEKKQREIAELLAKLIAKQQVLRNDTAANTEAGKALGARQSVLARDAGLLHKMLQEQASTGASADPDLAEQYGKIAQAFDQRSIRPNMLIATERLSSDAKPEALRKQDEVIKDLLDIQRMLAANALASANEQAKDALDGLRKTKAKVDKLSKLQDAAAEIAKQLHKTEDLSDGKETSGNAKLKDLKAVKKNIADAIEQLALDTHLLPDMVASNDLLSELSEVYEQVRQAKGSEHSPASELAVTNDAKLSSALHQLQKNLAKRIPDLEMWLSNKPDNLAWKQESSDKHDMDKLQLPDLQDKLEDIIGDLLDQDKDIAEKSQDSASNAGAPDAEMGWDIADGPMPDWAAKGKSGNTKPNSNEQTGRAGSGRQGKSDGEIVGDTLKGLKGADVKTRRTEDGFQAGELKEEDGNKMDSKATGGGKLAGASDREGMNGNAPARNELKYRSMQRQMRQLRSDTQSVYSKARLLKLPTGQLDRALLEMDAASRRLDDGDIEGFQKAQQQVIRALRQTQAQLAGKESVETAGRQSQDQKITGATNEPIPRQYDDAVAQYMRAIEQEK